MFRRDGSKVVLQAAGTSPGLLLHRTYRVGADCVGSSDFRLQYVQYAGFRGGRVDRSAVIRQQ